MEETKIIEMNDEALEVAEGFVEDSGVSVAGKVIIGATLLALGTYVTYRVVKCIKDKKAAKNALQTVEILDDEHTEIVDDDSEEI